MFDVGWFKGRRSVITKLIFRGKPELTELYLYFLCSALDDSTSIECSLRKIGALTQVSYRTISRYIEELEEIGAIKAEIGKNGIRVNLITTEKDSENKESEGVSHLLSHVVSHLEEPKISVELGTCEEIKNDLVTPCVTPVVPPEGVLVRIKNIKEINTHCVFAERIIELWNQKTGGKIRFDPSMKHDDKRFKRLRVFEKKYKAESLTIWEMVVDKIVASDFLSGRALTKRGNVWKAQFDWALNMENLRKVLEGNYDNNSPLSPAANTVFKKGITKCITTPTNNGMKSEKLKRPSLALAYAAEQMRRSTQD